MVHREYNVGIGKVFLLENGVCRQWTGNVDTLFAQFVQRRGNGFDFFPANVTILTRMGV